jgi:hypothetical protein
VPSLANRYRKIRRHLSSERQHLVTVTCNPRLATEQETMSQSSFRRSPSRYTLAPCPWCHVRGLPDTENLHFTFSRRTRTTTLLYCLCPEFPAASFSAPAALQSFSSPLPASRVPWPRVLQRITANFSVLDTTSAKTTPEVDC